METKVIDAKCPYCKTDFKSGEFGNNWVQILWGQYAPESVKNDCKNCGKTCSISVTQTYKYTAKKG